MEGEIDNVAADPACAATRSVAHQDLLAEAREAMRLGWLHALPDDVLSVLDL